MNQNLLKKIPNLAFKEKNALVILTTQRSGSTMLCEDIENLGVFGNPNEHFVDILYQLRGRTGEELWRYFTSRGNLQNSDFFSVKLMYNYLPEFGYWVSDRAIPYGNEMNNEKLRQWALRFFLNRFEKVTFIYLKRKNKFEQAVSHYRAVKTNVWHQRTCPVAEQRPSELFDEERPLLEHIDVDLFDMLYDTAYQEDTELERLIKKLNIDHLPLVYEEIKNDPSYLLQISAKTGIEIDLNRPVIRQNQKIVSDVFVSEFRKALCKKTARIYMDPDGSDH